MTEPSKSPTTAEKRDILDTMASAMSRVLFDMGDDNPGVEYALMRLCEAQHWWRRAAKFEEQKEGRKDAVADEKGGDE